MQLFIFAILMLLSSSSLQPQNAYPKPDEERVFWSVTALPIGATNAYVVFFDAEILDDWYLYSRNQTLKSDDIPPPAITLLSNPQVSLSGFINEIGNPISEIDPITKAAISTLSGKVTYNTVVTKKTNSPVTLQGYIDYSVCTKGLCKKPPRKAFEIVLN